MQIGRVQPGMRALLLAAGMAAACSGGSDLADGLLDRGIRPALTYDADLAANLSGGLRRGCTHLGAISLQLTADGERLLAWPGTTLFLYGLGTHGGQPDRRVGDAQGVSNIAAPAGWRLEEAWLQKNFLGNRASLLVGRYDLNSEFYSLDSAGLFLDSSFGIGPEFAQSGKQGPSIFPDTSVGARLAVKPAHWAVLRAAVLDGVPVDRPNGTVRLFAPGDGLLLVAEADYLSRPLPGDGRPGHRFRIGRGAAEPSYDWKVALGTWHYTTKLDDLNETTPSGEPVQHRGSSGLYALADGTLYRDPAGPSRRLTVFGQLGIADPRVNRFGRYLGGGFTLSGPLASCPADEAGLAVAAAYNGGHYLAEQRRLGSPAAAAEVIVELSYLMQLKPWLALQPDLQYVVHPDTDPAVDNALVALLRIELAF
jgi:porin